MRVMIVDNDGAWTRSLELLLRERGYQVAAFTEPERACDYIDQITHAEFLPKADLPDVVVLDYVMPRLNGFQVLARIAPNLKADCVVLFVTGHGDQLGTVDLAQMGVAGCLEKPVDVDELVRVLEGKAA